MKSVILIYSKHPNIEYMSKIYRNIGSTNIDSPERLVVEGDFGWFAIGVDDSLEGDFSELERAEIAMRILAEDPVYAQLEYSNSYAVNLAIKLMPTTTETLIDNDHGRIRSIEEVRDLIRAGMEWQTDSEV